MNFKYLTLSLAFVASPALAAPTILQANGTVTSISALQNSLPTSAPAGVINIGDSYSLTATFDLGSATLTSLFDADPTINLYHLPGSVVTINVGAYNTTFSPIFDFNSSVQFWNDRDVGGPVDAQSFSFFRFQAPSSEVPFDLGIGPVSYSTDLYAFDFTAQARNNDLISPLVPLDLFSSKSFSLGFLNPGTNLFVHVSGSVSNAQLITAAVPEPSSWLMMLFGFAAVGAMMRKANIGITQTVA